METWTETASASTKEGQNAPKFSIVFTFSVTQVQSFWNILWLTLLNQRSDKKKRLESEHFPTQYNDFLPVKKASMLTFFRRDVNKLSELEIDLYIADMIRLRKKKRKFYLQY
jgi:hypothetical protein